MPRVKKAQTVATEPTFVMPKDLNPRDPDTKYFGFEPKFLEQPENHKIALMAGLTWYNRFYGKKEAKEFMINYLEQSGKSDLVKKIGKIPDSEYVMSYGWVARMALRGLILNEKEQSQILSEAQRLINKANELYPKNSMTGSKKEAVVSNRPNVQEIMKDRAREAGGELEGIYDDYILDGAKKEFNVRVMEELSKKSVLPQHINILIEPWKKRQEEYLELQKGKDAQLNEAYARFSKTQVKNILLFIDKVIADLNGYVSVKKSAKTPRAKKPVSVEKQVSKLKYLKVFKDEATKLDLVGLPATKLYGASEAWVYDTAKRKMHHYIADEYAKSFGVKGNTLLGFDQKQSEVKTLRKPNEQIKQLMGSKPVARKYFKDIKAVSTTPNGRFNAGMIILKAF
jgi:hypothetical protein